MNKLLLKVFSGAISWSDIYQGIKKINEENRKLAGTLFEFFCKAYYEALFSDEFKNVWLLPEVPSSTKQLLNLSEKDYGIDLVIKTSDDKYIAVQCKFSSDQDRKVSWSKDKIANLFAEGTKCDYYIVFTNTSGVDSHSVEQYKDKLTVVTCGDLQGLNKSSISLIRRILEARPTVERKHFNPRSYQKEAIEAVAKGFRSSDRGKLILPCGAGKTFTALWIKERIKPKRTLVLVPSLALLRQFHESWRDQQKHYAEYLCVCSEKDIDRGSDTNVSHTYELQAPGRVTTKPSKIREFLKKPGSQIIYSTYQSSPQIASALKDTNIKIDLVICDEAHKTAGERIKSTFATILDDKKIPTRKRLFMTATPRVVSEVVKSRLGDEHYKYLADMNDADTYGPEFYHMSFAEAIRKKILVDYKIVAVGVSDEELQGFIRQRKFADDTTIDEIANNYALEKVMKDYGCTHAVTFHSSVKKAQAFQERHEEYFTGKNIFHVNGKKTSNERARLLNEFRESKKAVITNARCLTEGVDVPAIDTVYFCDPKYSKIDIVQASGRALRQDKEKGKKFGYVVVPVYHRKKEDIEAATESGVFSQLVRVVRAMADQDERIEEEIREVCYGEGIRSPSKRRIRISLASAKLIELDGFEEKLRDSIFFQTIRKAVVARRPFKQAREFIRSLKFKNNKGWRKYCRGELPKKGNLPDDIPTNPNRFYRNKGWVSWGDWLGTGKIATYFKKYRSFKEAREFVHKLKLVSRSEWGEYCKGRLSRKGNKPEDISASPNKTYKDKGWIGMGDWLGTGTIAPNLREYRPFKEAREFARSLKLRSGSEWRKFCKGEIPGKGKRPNNIPSAPRRVYKNEGWVSVGDWLGTGTVAPRLRKYRLFKEAREFVQKLGLTSRTEWEKYCGGKLSEKGKLPDDIPSNASRVYKNKGWIGWGDWLGTGTVASWLRKYRLFKEAREFARGLKLKNWHEWQKYCKGKMFKKGSKPDDIPAAPHLVYKDKGWKGIGDWLGTGTVAPWLRKYRLFEEAREFTRSLKLKSGSEWQKYCKGEISKKSSKPYDIPNTPRIVYKNKGWVSMGDWLGTGTIAPNLREYRPFEEARKFARSLKLKSLSEWERYCKDKIQRAEKLPDDIPACPNQTYKDKGWIGMGDWLGTGTIAPNLREYRPFKEAREFARSLKLKSGPEWRKFCKGRLSRKGGKPEDISASPNKTYKDKGWIGMGDWLGTGTIAPRLREYRSFKEARKFVQKLRLTSRTEWEKYCRGKLFKKGKLPRDIPADPRRVYKDKGWRGIGDWLGTGSIATHLRKYRPFKEARKFIRSLKLKSGSEWRKFYKGKLSEKGILPDDIPRKPDHVYKDKGWLGMKDWLGN